MLPERTVLALIGPTAVGKTAIAIEIARRLPISLISLDSVMVYRDMDVGTAKPSPEILQDYPHALINIRDPRETYSAADFVADADREIRSAWLQARIPLLVGGTMLYLRAFREGLARLPRADPATRDQILADAARLGWPALHQRLTEVDPVAAQQIHPNNPQRLQRALEVWALTGKPISQWWRDQGSVGAVQRLDCELREFAILPDDRSRLQGRIAERFEGMLQAGLKAEVEALRQRGDLHLGLPAIRAVGYRQVWEWMDGLIDEPMMRERGISATRRLAKRQLTWLRSWPWVSAHSWGAAATLAGEICLEIS
ncbi:MAG: tRNA (adenosine(37)-N6)-dimethylallyltransferase MiaA [Gammaproteobacteria bacterium]|nr:tRNA (adenosine(37)-N6)-dimethylallyltransferase MiaA [Gammaproteobacteria bacterium]